MIRQMLGRLAQDPHDDNFEEGELGITKPVYSPVLSLMTKIYGETKTVVVSVTFLKEGGSSGGGGWYYQVP